MREGLQSDEPANPARARPAREHLDEEMREAGITADDIVETIHDPLVVLTPDLRVQAVKPAFYEHFHEVELRLTVPDQPVSVETDRGKLTQIVTNLVGNAQKFSGSPVDVRVSVEDDWVRISVQDSGPGIPADRQAEIFEPFTKLDGSTTREKGGTGLRLPQNPT